MCQCTPNIRTPFCGRPGCEWPSLKRPEGARLEAPEATAAQPAPNGHGPAILPLVVADLEARAQLGLRKYGEVLHAANGRDALVDAYQEATDLVMYLRQAIEDRRGDPTMKNLRSSYPNGMILRYDAEGRLVGSYNLDFFDVVRRAEVRG